MANPVSVEQLLEKLHEDLYASAFHESELTVDDVSEIIKVFCRHRRLLRVLLTLCAED